MPHDTGWSPDRMLFSRQKKGVKEGQESNGD